MGPKCCTSRIETVEKACVPKSPPQARALTLHHEPSSRMLSDNDGAEEPPRLQERELGNCVYDALMPEGESSFQFHGMATKEVLVAHVAHFEMRKRNYHVCFGKWWGSPSQPPTHPANRPAVPRFGPLRPPSSCGSKSCNHGDPWLGMWLRSALQRVNRISVWCFFINSVTGG